MKRYTSILLFIFVLQCLLLNACSKSNDAPLEIKKTEVKQEPRNIEYSFDGYCTELDGDNIVINRQGMLKVVDLKNNKTIKEIPTSKEYSLLGLDISGEVVTWAETNPKSVKNSDSRAIEKENSDIYIYNLKTDEKKQITKDESAQMGPKIWKNYLIWQDNREDKIKGYPGRWGLYLLDLNTGEERKITSTLAAHATYNIIDNKVVWEDERNFKGTDIVRGGDNLPENNKDIYMYDIKAGTESVIADGKYMECKPDVYGNYVVWEDRNNKTISADILLYNVKSKEKTYITKDEVDQGTPRIFGDYIVWMDERRGTSTNDVIINGNAPNSDILIYDIKNKTERILTGDEPQIQPAISSEWVAFILSRQVGAKIQVVKYK